jgi:GNAT superfamily N-acetyltransferase
VNGARRVEKLRPDHPIEGFDCGREELNRYLLRYAWANQQAGAAQTWVGLTRIGLAGDAIVGYYTLAVGQITREEAPERLTKGLARHPVPIMLLARLAVALTAQGQGVGKALLGDAMRRTLQAAEIAGIRAFAVHAKDESARRFYEKFDFIPSPADPMHLFVLLKDVRRIMSGQAPPETSVTAKSGKPHQ